jgi:hypothetical protein
MDYSIYLAPELGIRPQDLATAWNETPECRASALARPEADASAQYTDPALAWAVTMVVLPLALGVGSNVLYDLIKKALAHQGVQKRVEITQTTRPDGSRLVVVKFTRG